MTLIGYCASTGSDETSESPSTIATATRSRDRVRDERRKHDVERVCRVLQAAEVAHLVEMNHSRRFWAQVARHCPDFRDQRRWLREHSRELKGRLR